MRQRSNHIPELLAPAGGPDALLAAVNNGADAVYLGLGTFNARRGAENFTPASLADGCRYAHLRGVRVYLTANVLLHDAELGDALAAVGEAWRAGVDAVIVQDLGFLRLLRRHLPEARLHASTQLGAHNTATVRELARLGVARVTLARETSLEEVARFAAEGVAEIETFVHGSLCYSYSGQCLFSSVIGARSANRGLCAQPCRLPYELIDEAGHVASQGGRYLLSPKDLAGITLLPALISSGVSALKIEGRMKSPEYVALVTRTYRAALDRAAADPDGFEVAPAEWAALEEAFSRGFTEAYLCGVRDERMMSRARPNNRGVPLGRVVSAAEGRATIALERAAEAEDVAEFWTGEGRFAQRLGAMRLGAGTVTAAPAGERVEVETEGRVSSGDRVFRVANAALLAAARRSFERGREPYLPVDVAFRVVLREGRRLLVEAGAEGATGRAEGPVVEPARTKPVTVAEVMEHVGRLGGTDWRAGSWEIDIEPGVGAGFSTLHRLRRDALDALQSELLRPWSGRGEPAPYRREAPARGRRRTRERPEIVVTAEDPRTLEAALRAGADRALLDTTSQAEPFRLPERVSALLPRVAHDGEVEGLRGWLAPGRPAAVGNLGVLAEAVAAGVRVEADWPLNALNAESVDVLATQGARLVWLSPELSAGGIGAVAAAASVAVGILAYGRVELMVAEHCALQAAGGCTGRCETCARRRSTWALRDQKGYRFPIVTDTSGRSHVYNSVTLDLSRALPEILTAGVAAIRLDFRMDSPDEAARITSEFSSRLRDAVQGRRPATEPIASPATSGHFYRGVR